MNYYNLMILMISLFSIIPKIDIYVTKKFYNKEFHQFSYLFPHYILYVNLFFNILISVLNFDSDWKYNSIDWDSIFN